ncbi:tetratricopeptide repeat protein [Streptomonospora arabica]|uniref:Tetratricopeptide repeat protein n=1 Tax=Streptomonospora arabica TaxID=412417 RepID=A0ABV9SGV8_9ACTN
MSSDNNAADVVGTVVQAGAVHGGIHLHPATTPGLVPHQLPAPRCFVNRSRDLDTLEAAWRGRGPSTAHWVAIDGPSGIGKTALATTWLSAHRDRWPDGLLYADLARTDTDTALGGWLHALGVPPAGLPHHPDHRTALWRSLSAQRRLAVLIDTSTPVQARRLLPAGAGCLGIATSQYSLVDLVADGATRLPLGTLADHELNRLLDVLLGADHPAPAPLRRAAAGACGGVPLAACLAAAHLARHPSTTPDQLTRSLTRETPVADRLTDLDARLPADQARAARLLALHPGPRISPTAARALLGETHTHLLHGLVEADLLHDHGHDHYVFHDAIRSWLHTRAIADLSEQERSAARIRLLEAYRDTTTAADLVLNPWRWRVAIDVVEGVNARQEANTPWFDDAAAALIWLDQEFTAIRALVALAHETGAHRLCWQLVESLKFYFTARRPYTAWEEIADTALDSAQTAGDTAGEAYMRLLLGGLENNRHDFLAARSHFRAAMPLWEHLDHVAGIASTLEGLGVTFLAQEDDLAAAVEILQQSLIHHQAIGRPRGIALQQRHLAEAFLKTRRLPEARALLEETIPVFTEAGDVYQTGRSQRHLARVHLAARDPDRAEAAARQALAAAQSADVGYEVAGIHVLLADIARHRGHPGTEHDHLAIALPLFERIGAPETADIRRRLDDLADD